MRQRAALLRTYLFSSDIMLLDMSPSQPWMPSPGPTCTTGCLGLLKKLNSSVLFITHDIDELYSCLIGSISFRQASQDKGRDRDSFILAKDKEVTTTQLFNDIKKYILEIF